MKNFLLKIMIDISNKISPFFGKIHFPFTRKMMTSKDYRSCKAVMRNGMILITNTNGELTSMLIPGFFSHVGMIVDPNTIIEATGKGVHKTDLIDFILSRDYAVLLKPKWLNYEQMDEAAMIAVANEGRPYDFEFSADTKSFYCSELAFHSYKMIDPSSPIELRNRMGQMTFVPEDFWRASQKFEIVWMSESFHNKMNR